MEKSSKQLWLFAGVAVLLLLATGLILFFAFRHRAPADEPGNLIVNGSFERPEIPAPEVAGKQGKKQLWMRGELDEMQPWETDLDSFELWANGLMMPKGNARVPIAPIKSAVGKQNIEIISDPVMGDDGQWKMAGAVWQAVKTSPGKRYTFSFYHSARPGAHTMLAVSLNDDVIATIPEDGTPLGTLQWKQFTTNFVADRMSTTVKFSDQTDVLGQGTHLDGVLLKPE